MAKTGAVAALVCLLIAAGVFYAGDALAQSQSLEKSVTRTGRTGQPINVGGHVRYNKDCSGVSLPKLVLTSPPQHGSICTRVEMMTLVTPLMDTSPPQCKGQRMRGLRVIYVSAPDFSGMDPFTYVTEFPRLIVNRKVEMIVKAAPVSASKNKSAVETPFAPQEPGPIPTCVALVS